jgi:hypothetical protein
MIAKKRAEGPPSSCCEKAQILLGRVFSFVGCFFDRIASETMACEFPGTKKAGVRVHARRTSRLFCSIAKYNWQVSVEGTRLERMTQNPLAVNAASKLMLVGITFSSGCCSFDQFGI